MDGLEYKRTKFNKWVRKFVFWEGRMAVKHSHYLIADNMGIHDYYKEKYGKFVLNEVLEAGNFGKHDERNRFGKSQLGHDLQRVYRDIRLVRYFPGEALCEPLFRTWHFFWRLKYKK